jgi:ABC-type sugar transport system substrate-binding protein
MSPSRYSLPALVATLVMALAVILTACSTGGGPAASNTESREADEIKVGAIMYARDLEFWRLIEAGMKRAAADHNVEINVEVSNRSLQTESQLIDTMTARGDNVFIVAPFDPTASAAGLRRVTDRGSTVVQYDSRVTDTQFEYFVGVDQRQLGKAVGEAAQKYVAEHLNGSAEFALLTGETEPNGPPRREAFLAAAPGVHVVTQAEAVGSPEAGAEAFETVLQSNPDIDGVFAWNGAALQGSVAAARRLGSDVKIFGIDQSEVVAKDMMSPDSVVAALADQQAYQVGYDAVTLGVKAALGEQQAATGQVDPIVYTAGDTKNLQTFLDELTGS